MLRATFLSILITGLTLVEGQVGRIESALPGSKCLHITGASPFVPVLLDDCDYAQPWLFDSGSSRIMALNDPNFCLTNYMGGVTLWFCSKIPYKEWEFIRDDPDSNSGQFRTQAGLCLDAQADLSPVEAYQCNGSQSQKWIFPM